MWLVVINVKSLKSVANITVTTLASSTIVTDVTATILFKCDKRATVAVSLSCYEDWITIGIQFDILLKSKIQPIG